MGQGARRSRPAPGWTVSPAGLSITTRSRILVEDPEIAPLGDDPLFPGLRRIAFDAVPSRQDRRGLCLPAVDRDEPFLDPPLDLVAGDAQAGGDVAVEPLSGCLDRPAPAEIRAHSAAVAAVGAS